MNYFSINYATRKIGRSGYPQTGGLELAIGRTVNDPDFMWNVRGDQLPEFKPYIGTIVLRKAAALTDFISSGFSTGFVCNDKVENIVKEYSYGLTVFYDLSVKHKNIVHDNYKIIHCLNNYVDKVDFDSSVFKRIKIKDNKYVGEPFPVTSLDDFLRSRKELEQKDRDWSTLEPGIIKFKNNFRPLHDIFIIWGLTYNTYVSERLRQAFQKNDVSGIDYDFDGKHVDFL